VRPNNKAEIFPFPRNNSWWLIKTSGSSAR